MSVFSAFRVRCALLNYQLESTLLGVYRFGNTFRIFPSGVGVDWVAISQHEYTHALLANSTSAGMVHRLLAYLATNSSDPTWRFVLGVSVDRARNTHEAAATFSELYAADPNLTRTEVFHRRNFSLEYQQYFSMMADVLPETLTRNTAVDIAIDLARYCLDVPIESIANCSYEQLRMTERVSFFPPPIDQRFGQLRDILRERGDLVSLLAGAAESVPHISSVSGERPAEYYARRRAASAERSFRIRERLRDVIGDQLPVWAPRSQWIVAARRVVEGWRAKFAVASDTGLENYRYTDVDSTPGPDPLLDAAEIIFSAKPLSGLFPSKPMAAMEWCPTLITATQAGARCELRPGLLLEKGQWYLRYFRLTNGVVEPPILYSIEETFPKVVMDSFVPLVLVGEASTLPSSWMLRTSGGIVIRTGVSLTKEIVERLSRFPDAHYGWLTWPEVQPIVVLAMYTPNLNELILCPTSGPSAEIAAENLSHQKRPYSGDAAVNLVRPLLPVWQFLFPQEGQPAS